MPDSQRTASTGPETPASLLQLQLSNIRSLSIRCLYTIVAAWRRASAALRSTSRGLRHRSAYLLKTFGVLVAIAFGTASVVYAKQAADDARFQLLLAERQYCEAAIKASAQSSECKDILRLPLSQVFRSVRLLSNAFAFHSGLCGMMPSYSYLVLSCFPDLYKAAKFFRGRVGTSLVCVGIALTGWMSLQRHGFLERRVLYSFVALQLGVVYLSWRLLEDDLVFQRKYWDGRVGCWEAGGVYPFVPGIMSGS